MRTQGKRREAPAAAPGPSQSVRSGLSSEVSRLDLRLSSLLLPSCRFVLPPTISSIFLRSRRGPTHSALTAVLAHVVQGMRKTNSNRRLSPPPWGGIAEDRPTGNNSRHDRGLREAPRTPRASSSLSATAVCRAVTEQTVGPSWVQARRVDPACSSRLAVLVPPRGVSSWPDNLHPFDWSIRSVGDMNRACTGPGALFRSVLSYLPSLSDRQL